VDPVVGLKGHKGMFAITKNGHLKKTLSKSFCGRGVIQRYLRMVERRAVFVNWLAQAIGARQCVITGHEVPNRFRTQIPALHISLEFRMSGSGVARPTCS
jgi:hypothetical protein